MAKKFHFLNYKKHFQNVFFYFSSSKSSLLKSSKSQNTGKAFFEKKWKLFLEWIFLEKNINFFQEKNLRLEPEFSPGGPIYYYFEGFAKLFLELDVTWDIVFLSSKYWIKLSEMLVCRDTWQYGDFVTKLKPWHIKNNFSVLGHNFALA